MEDRKACVRIYGQDYTISGERDEKTIIKIAAYVDEKMREISKYFTDRLQSLPLLILPMNILRQKRRFPSLRPRPARRRRIPSIT